MGKVTISDATFKRQRSLGITAGMQGRRHEAVMQHHNRSYARSLDQAILADVWLQGFAEGEQLASTELMSRVDELEQAYRDERTPDGGFYRIHASGQITKY